MSKKGEERQYPYCCQSINCGRVECSECENEPKLLEFKTWKKKHAAVQDDYIWCPTIWRATK